jgi:HD superfamily phosphodiesterase
MLYKKSLKKYKNVIEFTRQHLQETASSWPDGHHPWGLSQHRMEHTLLVLRNSLVLSANRKVDLDVVILSAILHDVAFYSPQRKDHAEEGAQNSREVLER